MLLIITRAAQRLNVPVPPFVTAVVHLSLSRTHTLSCADTCMRTRLTQSPSCRTNHYGENNDRHAHEDRQLPWRWRWNVTESDTDRDAGREANRRTQSLWHCRPWKHEGYAGYGYTDSGQWQRHVRMFMARFQERSYWVASAYSQTIKFSGGMINQFMCNGAPC